MEFLQQAIDFILHIDTHLSDICAMYGAWVYFILFLIVFCETGLVVTPFLPGDSLLFAVGTLAAIQALDVWTASFILIIAAILGDTANYWIGSVVGPKVFDEGKSRFFKKEHLDRTHQFYERYGGKTIIIARFVPIIRTFAPFVAGIGSMTYSKFVTYNVVGGIVWVVLFVFAGYFFGNIPIIRKNFTIVIFVIIFISMLPGIIEIVRHRMKPRRSA